MALIVEYKENIVVGWEKLTYVRWFSHGVEPAKFDQVALKCVEYEGPELRTVF